MPNTYQYPFDPTGTRIENKVTGEQQILTIINEKHYNRIIPRWAPFFQEGLQLRIRLPDSSIKVLEEGKDYYLGNHFLSASRACAKNIYGSINFINRTLQGTVVLDSYQTLGGMWTIDQTKIAEILANHLYNPRIVTWESVVDMPVMFPVINHEWNIVDMVGMSHVNEKLESIAVAINSSSESGLLVHIADENNPHKVTKTQIGLGDVQNYPIATKAQAEAGLIDIVYMTPIKTKDAITLAIKDTVAHLEDFNNPHNVTKTQLGLSNVQNYPIATQTQAEEGSSNDTYMTPIRTRQAIDLKMGVLDLHTKDKTNPHDVTKDQVGLGNVANYSIATSEEVIEGISTETYMTPAGTKLAITEQTKATFGGHLENFNNPHQVNASQVGLGNVANYGLATTAQAVEGKSNTAYMTPLRVKEAIGASLGESSDHLNDKTNPHQTTKAQVGLSSVENYPPASLIQASNGESNELYMTPLTTKEAIDNQIAIETRLHLANKNNPHEVTAQQIGAVTETYLNDKLLNKLSTDGTAANTILFSGKTFEQVMEEILNGTIENSFKLEGKTLAQIMADILSGKIADSHALNGMNIDQLTAYIATHLTGIGELNVVATDTARFNGKTYEEAKADILSGSVEDTAKFGGIAIADFFAWILDQIEALPLLNVKVTDSEKLEGKTLAEIIGELGAVTAFNSERFNGFTREEFIGSLATVSVGSATKLEGMDKDRLSNYVTNKSIFEGGLGFSKSFSMVPNKDVFTAVGKSIFGSNTGLVEVEINLVKNDTNKIVDKINYQFFVRTKSITGYKTSVNPVSVVDLGTIFDNSFKFTQASTVELPDNEGNAVITTSIKKSTKTDSTVELEDLIIYTKPIIEEGLNSVDYSFVIKTTTWGGVIDTSDLNGNPLVTMPVTEDPLTYGNVSIINAIPSASIDNNSLFSGTVDPFVSITTSTNLDITNYELVAYEVLYTPIQKNSNQSEYVLVKTDKLAFDYKDLNNTKSLVIYNKSAYIGYFVVVANKLSSRDLAKSALNTFKDSDYLTKLKTTPSVITLTPNAVEPNVKINTSLFTRLNIQYTNTSDTVVNYDIVILDDKRTNVITTVPTVVTDVPGTFTSGKINTLNYVNITNAKPDTLMTVKIYGSEKTNTLLSTDIDTFTHSELNDTGHDFFIKGAITQVVHLSEYSNLKHFAFNSANAFTVPTKLPKTVDSLELTFASCPYFNDINVASWDTSFVKSFEKCFFNARNFNQDLSNWATNSMVIRPYAFDTNAAAWTDASRKPKFIPYSALGAAINDLDFSL